jgi:hypothetical protein
MLGIGRLPEYRRTARQRLKAPLPAGVTAEPS